MSTRRTLALNIFKTWLPLAVAVTLLCGLLYLCLQQYIRQSANDQQIQLAEDAKVVIENGQSPQTVIPPTLVDMATSLDPYVIIFDGRNEPLASSVQLQGKTPQPPGGVFDFVRTQGVEKFTWQPVNGVRSAAVMLRTAQGYVLAGKSLREVENHENLLSDEVLVGWLSTLVLTLVVVAIIKSPTNFNIRGFSKRTR